MQERLTVQQALQRFAEYEHYDNHSLSVIQSCHRKGFHHLVGPYGQPLAIKVGEAANFGSVWHAGLAGYYERSNSQLPFAQRCVRAVQAFNKEWQKQFANHQALANKYKLARGVQQLLLYFDRFRSEDEFFRVVDSEVGFIFLIKPRPAEHPFKPFAFTGRIDRILYRETMKDLVVGETKTCSGDPSQRLKEMRIDRQTQGYYKMLQLEAERNGRDERCGGVILDAAQISATKITNDIFDRDFVQLRPADGEQWRLETIEIVQQWRAMKARAEGLSGDNAKVLAVFDKRTAECTRYGICPFYDLCLYGITSDTMADMKPNTWHPLKPDDEVVVDTGDNK